MRAIFTYLLVPVFFFMLTATISQPADAQILKRLGQRAKDKVEQKVGEKQDQAIDRIMDGDAKANSEEEGETEEISNKESTGDEGAVKRSTETSESAAEVARLKPGEGAWANFDFVPGERILFAEDFSTDRVGNFPKRFEFISGNAEIVDWNGQKWLRMNEETFFKIPLPENLPDRFTVEFDVTIPWWGMKFHSDANVEDEYNRYYFETSGVILGCCEAGVYRGKGEAASSVDPRDYFENMFNDGSLSQPMRFRLHVDGNYIKVYLEEKRVANMPNGNFGRNNYLIFHMTGSADEPEAPLITNFSINAGGTPMYDALMSDGRFSTQGILFDTGSDRIRPESTPTLNDIGDMLKQHTDLRILIEGHTDNVGSDESNQVLSEKRAAAVRDFLINTYNIDGNRLESAGYGASKPAASNDTAEGRQQNRRVELVRL